MRRLVAFALCFTVACASLPAVVQTLITLDQGVGVALTAFDNGEETFCQAVPAVPPATAETCANPKDSAATHARLRADISKAYVLQADIKTGLGNIKAGTPIPAQLVQSLSDLNTVLQDALSFDPNLDPSIKPLVSVTIATVQAVILSIPVSSATTQLLALQDTVTSQRYVPEVAAHVNAQRHADFLRYQGAK